MWVCLVVVVSVVLWVIGGWCCVVFGVAAVWVWWL
jgi:hypothetical protein